MEIKRAAVIGAGVMGGGIAAHLANAGVPVVLLDLVPGAAAATVAKLLKTEPAAFMHASAARLVTAGNLDDALPLVADADWIIEAIIEKPAAKSALYQRLDAVRKPGSVVSSNTSTIPLAALIAGQSERFAADFLITHFFNPPRYMRLLELVTGPATRPEAAAAIAAFADHRLGKGVVPCHDRPGFIANRIGAFWIQSAVNAALDFGLTVEEADAVISRPFGIPKTGVFGLLDLVGLDLMPHVAASLVATLPKDDAYAAIQRPWPLAERLVAEGFTGRKGKGGFYRLDKSGGSRVKLALDLVSGTYRPQAKPALDSLEASREAGKAGGLKALISHPDRGGQFARAVFGPTLAYAARLVPEIADTVADVDRAMRLGYNWSFGPFELIDKLGADWLSGWLRDQGQTLPPLLAHAAGRPFYRTAAGRLDYLDAASAAAATTAAAAEPVYRPLNRGAGVLLLSDIKRGSKPVARNGSAALWDIGDRVLCLEFTSKMNAIDTEILAMARRAIEIIGDGTGAWQALVIHNEGENFSVGANLGMAMVLINVALWPQIEAIVADGQNTYRALRHAPFPVVGAPSGMALGGGCEILLHCDAVQAHAETYMGLVEVGVGLLPAWGGSTTLLTRWAAQPRLPHGPMPPVAKAFETIALAKVGKSAAEARELLYLRPSDGITMNRDRLLADAKAKALELVRAGYHPPPPAEPLSLPGPAGRLALGLMVEGLRAQGKATPHDVVVSDAVATVLTGADADPTEPVTEEALIALERRQFMRLVRTAATIDRIEHMLTTGKPLRN